MPNKDSKLKRFRLYLPEELMEYAHRQDASASKFIEGLVCVHARGSVNGEQE